MRGEDEFDPQQNSERELSVIGQSVSDRALRFTLLFCVFVCLHVKFCVFYLKVRNLFFRWSVCVCRRAKCRSQLSIKMLRMYTQYGALVWNVCFL